MSNVEARAASRSKPLRVLVVDDEHAIADSLAAILAFHGYAPRTAYDGAAALAAVGDFQPHAVISDVVMPKLNGIELALLLAECCPECKVLLMSGNTATAQLIEESARNGHNHIVFPKPVFPAQVLEFMASCDPEEYH